jgi:glycosyltransferase involved in cell wall biosynthesis
LNNIKKLRKFVTVDVGIPLFNEEKQILKTLKCLESQSYRNIRFIIFDNCSTDNTRKICLKFIKKKKNFFYFKNKNKVTSFENFNNTFYKSNSKYFCWNSGHDLRSKNFFKDSVEFMERNNKVVLCFGNVKINNKNNKLINKSNEMVDTKFLSRLFYHFNINYNYQVYGVFRSQSLKKTTLLENFIGSDLYLIKFLSFLGTIRKIMSSSFTSMTIKYFGNWNEYFSKHMLMNNYSFFKEFLLFIYRQISLYSKFEKNIIKLTIYVFLMFYKESVNIFFYYKQNIIKWIKINIFLL